MPYINKQKLEELTAFWEDRGFNRGRKAGQQQEREALKVETLRRMEDALGALAHLTDAVAHAVLAVEKGREKL